MRLNKRNALLGCSLIAAQVPANAVQAQTSPDRGASQDGTSEADGREGGLETIVVTAQKRTENLQDVPIAVTSLSANALEAKGVENVLDLNAVVPSLSYTTQAASASPRIRGVGTSNSTGGNENSVSTYVDGVYYASAPASVLSLNNVEQITVLKGPQGTLFGRNATGGLIQITTRTPGQDFEGEVKATYGNHDTFGGDIYLGGGLAPNLAADIAVHYLDQTDGFGVNLLTGNDVNKSRDISLRSKWIADLGAATRVTAIFDYSDSIYRGPAHRPVRATLPATGQPFRGGDFDVDSDIDPRSKVEQYGMSVEVRHDLGSVELVSISAYRESTWDVRFDSDSTPAPLIDAQVYQKDRQFSQELQLVSEDTGAFQWVVGGFFFDARAKWDPAILTVTAAGIINTIRTTQSTKSFAAFGQGTYDLSERTSATLGLRWTTEEKSIDGSGTVRVIGPGFIVPQGPYAASQSVDKLTWRFALNHQLADNVMAYASYNRGFKSGGFDPGKSAAAASFNPEVVDAFELGLKSEVLDRTVRFNAAAFYYDYKDIQLNTYQAGLLAIYNGDSAKIYGVDADLTVSASRNLRLTFGGSWLHGRYGDFPITATAPVPGGGIAQLPDISADGKRLQSTPDYQLNAGFDYSIDLPTAALRLAANLFHSGGWYSTPENRAYQPAYTTVSASATYFFDAAEKYSLKLWGRNLFNQAYANSITTQIPFADFVSIAPGRTLGATLGLRF